MTILLEMMIIKTNTMFCRQDITHVEFLVMMLSDCNKNILNRDIEHKKSTHHSIFAVL